MPRPKKQIGFKATFRILGKNYTSEGKTIDEALQTLSPSIVKAHGILTVEKGSAAVQKILSRSLVIRLFGQGSPLTRQVAIKQTSQLFDSLN